MCLYTSAGRLCLLLYFRSLPLYFRSFPLYFRSLPPLFPITSPKPRVRVAGKVWLEKVGWRGYVRDRMALWFVVVVLGYTTVCLLCLPLSFFLSFFRTFFLSNLLSFELSFFLSFFLLFLIFLSFFGKMEQKQNRRPSQEIYRHVRARQNNVSKQKQKQKILKKKQAINITLIP